MIDPIITNDPEGELRLLKQLSNKVCAGCEGKNKSLAYNLEKRGLAIWRGISYGTNYWSISEQGITFLKRLERRRQCNHLNGGTQLSQSSSSSD